MDRILGPVLGPLGSLLSACYALINNYAVAIALFTLVIMVIFTPLTMKSTRSMMQMQQIQPEMKALQAKYRDDRQTLNTEMMALYQSHGVNPLGGCLPMLVQIPVFFALFALLRGLTRLNSDRSQFDPEYIDSGSQLFKDLSNAGGEMLSLGIDLSQQANEVVSDDLLRSVPYVLMVVITGITSWFQQRQMASRRTPGQEIPQQQQMLMKILPWTLPVFAFFMPAGLVVYFIVSNLWRVGQQSYISRRIHTPAANGATNLVIDADSVDKTKADKSGSSKSGSSKPGSSKSKPEKPGSSKAKPPKGTKNGAGKTSADPQRPRPRSRQGDRPTRDHPPGKSGSSRRNGKQDADDGAKSRKAKQSKANQRGKRPAPRGPAPTSRTAGHGPNRSSNKKKKR